MYIPSKSKSIIFGYDIFISYSRKDSLDYAYTIAQYFMKKGYECYIDQLSSITPGRELPPNIKDAVKRSTAFVLIGSEGAQTSEAIEKEIQLFLENNRNKPLIPITVAGAINENARWYEKIAGLALIDDTGENLKVGTPAQDVLDRIENALRFTKKSTRLRYVSLAVLAGIFIISSLAALFAYYKTEEAEEANRLRIAALFDKEQADHLKTVALSEKEVAVKQRAQADSLKEIADSLKSIAEAQIKEARQELVQTNFQLAKSTDDLLKTEKIRQNEQGRMAQVLANQPGKQLDALRIGLTAVNSKISTRPEPEAVFGMSTAFSSFLLTRRLPVPNVRNIAYSDNEEKFITINYKGVVEVFDKNYNTIRQFSTGVGSYNDQPPLISKNGAIILAPGSMHLRVLHATSGKVLDSFPAVSTALAFLSDDGRYVAITNDRNSDYAVIRDNKTKRTDTVFHDNIKNVVFSSSGRVITVGADFSPKLWSLDGSLIKVLEGHEEEILHAGFSVKGDAVGTGSNDGTAKIWSADDGSLVQTLNKHSKEESYKDIEPLSLGDDPDELARRPGGMFLILRNRGVNYVDFSPNASNLRIATAGKDRKGILWTSDGSDLANLTGSTKEVKMVRFSADGRLLLTASSDGSLIIWDAKRGRPLDVYKGNGKEIQSASFITQRNKVLIACNNEAIVWTPFQDLSLVDFRTAQGVASSNFSPDGRHIYTSDWLGNFSKWNAATGKLISKKAGNERDGDVVDLLNGLNMDALEGSDDLNAETQQDEWRRLKLDRIGNPLPPGAGQRPRNIDLMTLRVSKDGSLALVPDSNGKITVWSTRDTNSKPIIFSKHTSPVKQGSFLGNTKLAITCDRSNGYIWNIENGSIVDTIPLLSVFDISPDGNTVVFAQSQVNQIVLMNINEKREKVFSLGNGEHVIRSVRLVKNKAGDRIAVLTYDSLFIFTTNGDLLYSISTKRLFPESISVAMENLVISPDGEKCLIVDHNQFKILGMRDYSISGGFKGGRASGIRDIEFSPDGNLIVMGCSDRSIKVCEGKTGNLLYMSRSHTGRVYEVNFSPDGLEFVSIGEDGIAKKFETPYLKRMTLKAEKILKSYN
jgi:WD40 repeat protein